MTSSAREVSRRSQRAPETASTRLLAPRPWVVRAGLFLLLLLACLYVSGWALAPGTCFPTDDSVGANYWSWRMGWEHYFYILPNGTHDDRPLGMYFLKLVWNLCGLNYHAQIALQLLVHYGNVLLLFLVLRKIFAVEAYAFLGSLLLAAYCPAIDAVTYIGAGYELVCMTFVLLSMWLFLRGTRISTLLSVACYFLSVRAKEISLGLPLILFFLAWSAEGFSLQQQSWRAALRKCWLFVPVLLVLGGALASRTLAAVETRGIYAAGGADNPYAMVVTPREFAKGLGYYLNELCCGAGNRLLLVLFATTLAAGIVWRRGRLLYGGIGMVITLLPVTFLVHHRMPLYLYVPLVFFIIYLLALLEWALSAVGRWGDAAQRWATWTAIAAFAGAVLAMSHLPAYAAHRVWQQEMGRPMGMLTQFLSREMPAVPPGTHFYLCDIPNPAAAFHPICHSAEHILQMTYRDPTIEAFGNRLRTELRSLYLADRNPRVFLVFGKEGIVRLDDDAPVTAPVLPRIVDYGPKAGRLKEGFNLQPDGRSALWIQAAGIDADAVIVWDDTPLKTCVVAEQQLLTAAVPEQLRARPGDHRIHLLDPQTKARSAEVTFSLTR